MRPFIFAETIPSNESVASAVTLLVCAWFTAAGAAMLAEPTADQQVRSLSARTPVVTVRQVATIQEMPDVRETIQVVAQRTGPGVS